MSEFTQAAICPFCACEIGINTEEVKQKPGSLTICTSCLRPSVVFGEDEEACLVKPPYSLLLEAFTAPVVPQMMIKAREIYNAAISDRPVMPPTNKPLDDNGTGPVEPVAWGPDSEGYDEMGQ